MNAFDFILGSNFIFVIVQINYDKFDHSGSDSANLCNDVILKNWLNLFYYSTKIIILLFILFGNILGQGWVPEQLTGVTNEVYRAKRGLLKRIKS